MGSFFKNLLKSNNQKIDRESRRPSKWLFMFKKAHDQIDSNNLIHGQEDNQIRLRNSNSASSLKSNNTSENNYSNDGIVFLPGMKNCCFNIPRFLPPCEWIKSQLFEIIHMLSSFVDLISPKNFTLSKDLDFQLDRIMKLIDDQNLDLKLIFVQIFGLESRIYNEEINFWMELRIETHLNSLIGQTLTLCSQLPGNQFSDVIESSKAQGSSLNFSAYKKSLEKEEYRSLSQQGSELSSSFEKIQ